MGLLLTLLLTAIKTQREWNLALKKEYEKTTYRFFLSGAPLLPITLTLTEWAMEKRLSNRTNRGGERAKGWGEVKIGGRKRVKRDESRKKAKGKVKGRVQDRFLLEWPGLGRVVERFLKGRSLFTADMTRLPCREGNASPQPCYY